MTSSKNTMIENGSPMALFLSAGHADRLSVASDPYRRSLS